MGHTAKYKMTEIYRLQRKNLCNLNLIKSTVIIMPTRITNIPKIIYPQIIILEKKTRDMNNFSISLRPASFDV